MPPKEFKSTYKFSNDDIMNASLMLQDAISNHLVQGIAEITQNVMNTKNKGDSAQYAHQVKLLEWQAQLNHTYARWTIFAAFIASASTLGLLVIEIIRFCGE